MNGKRKMENGIKPIRRRWLLLHLVTIFSLLILSLGCDNVPTEVVDYSPEPVLSGFIYNGIPVEEVFLERIAPFDPGYNPRDAGIRNASVKIFGGGDTLVMVDDPAYGGRYVPADGQSLIPQSKTRYRIEVTTPASESIWAETVVPDTFQFVNIILRDRAGNVREVHEGDTLTRNDPNMFWVWSPCDSAGGYTGMIVNNVPRDSLVPLDPDWDPAVDSVEAEQRTRAGFTIMRDDQSSIQIAWIFFRWEGPQRVELMAISRDYYDYLFSSFRVQQGIIERATSNIQGGLGIFAGASRRAINVYMKRVEG